MIREYDICTEAPEVNFIQSGTATGLRYQNIYAFDMRAFIDEKNTFKSSDLPIIKVLDYDELLEIEKAVYESNKGFYLSLYDGKYIALLDGEVKDYDSDFSNLARRVYSKFPDAPIYMPFVSNEDRKAVMSSPRT